VNHKKKGIIFWKEENIYLTKEVTPQYISVYEIEEREVII